MQGEAGGTADATGRSKARAQMATKTASDSEEEHNRTLQTEGPEDQRTVIAFPIPADYKLEYAQEMMQDFGFVDVTIGEPSAEEAAFVLATPQNAKMAVSVFGGGFFITTESGDHLIKVRAKEG